MRACAVRFERAIPFSSIAMALTNWAASRGQRCRSAISPWFSSVATHGANPLDEILTELKRRGESEGFADDVSLLAIKMH